MTDTRSRNLGLLLAAGVVAMLALSGCNRQRGKGPRDRKSVG